MPIDMNDSLKIRAGKPAEPKSFYTDNKAYLNTAQVLATVPVAERHEYLPVNVAGVRYWFLPYLVTLVKIPSNITVDVPLTFINGVVSLSFDTATMEVVASKLQVKHGVYPELDAQGKVPVMNLPGVIPDIIEVANYAALPVTGATATIYITKDDLKQYRWGGTVYGLLSASLVLGDLSSNAYPGNKGKIAYDHTFNTTTNPHNVTKAQVGLQYADNTSDANKPVSIAQQIALDQKSNNGHGHTIPQVDQFTEALAARVVGPGESANDCICIFDGITGKLIKLSNVTIDASGQMAISANGVGLISYGLGEYGYGVVGMAKNIPIQATTLDTAPNGIKLCLVSNADAASTENVEPGYGLEHRFDMPVLNMESNQPAASERVIWSDVTPEAESARFEWWTLRGGAWKKQGVLTEFGQMQVNSLKLTPLSIAPANPTGGEMYHNTNGHVYKFNASTLVWDDMDASGTVPGPDSIVLTSADGSVKINKYDLSVPRAEFELFADNETELLSAWAIAIAYGKAARIYITNNIVFTANRQFIQPYGAPAIKMECITQRYFYAGAYVIDFNNVVHTNITFRTTGAAYLRLVGGIGTFNNCGWVDDSTDIGTWKKNIVVTGPIASGTAKIVIKTPTHFTQDTASNASALIQPFWIINEAIWNNSASERIYIEIREMAAVYEAARFSRVALTSVQPNCPYSVTADDSWFYHPLQPIPGYNNIKSTAIIAKYTSLRIYSALLNQIGNNVISTSFKNDIAAPEWIRTAAGTYTLTKAGAFPSGKTIPVKQENYTDPDGNLFKLIWTSADVMTLKTYAAVNTDILADFVLINRYIYIEINA